LIVTDEVHGGARPQAQRSREKTRAAFLPHLAQGAIPVVTGYIASTARSPTTLGAADRIFPATILGAALDAERKSSSGTDVTAC